MEDILSVKYIVYITTNTVNNKIYIGVHKTQTPDKFDGCLGCGVKINDRHSYMFSRTPFEAAVNKYGPSKFIRKTLKTFDKLEDALDLEKQLVDSEFIRRKDTYNVALGGGLPKPTTKTIYQYSLNGEFITEWNSIVDASIKYKCSSSCIGKAIFDRTPSLGYLWTDYKYEHIDLSTFHIDENKTKCYTYSAEGKFIKEYKSIHDCAKEIETTAGNVANAIKGKYLIYKTYYVSDIKYETFPIQDKVSYDDGIYQYDLEGNFIKHYESFKCLPKEFGAGNICRAVRTGNTAFGFQWSNKKLKHMKKLSIYNKPRKVGKYTLEGELIQVFNTVREAKKDTCGAPNVLTGKRKTAGGYVWKYIE